MSNSNKPPTAFEVWYAREGLAYDPYAKRAMQVAWNASKREALEQLQTTFRAAGANLPINDNMNCIERGMSIALVCVEDLLK